MCKTPSKINNELYKIISLPAFRIPITGNIRSKSVLICPLGCVEIQFFGINPSSTQIA
jgi:hypothetical protein